MRLNKIEDTCSMYELGRMWDNYYGPYSIYAEKYYKTEFNKLLSDLDLSRGVIICNVSQPSIYDKPLRNLGFRPKFKYIGYDRNNVTTYVLHIKDGKPYKYNWFTRFFENM